MRRVLCLILCLLLTVPAFAEEDLFAWTARLGGSGVTIPMAMALATGGGVFIAGETDGGEGDFGAGFGRRDGFIARLDASGQALWLRRYGGKEDDVFTHVLATSDGGCVAMGFSSSRDGHARAPRGLTDAFLVRVSAEGKTIWTKNLGGSRDDELLDIVETEDGKFLVCGRSRSYNGDLPSNNGGWDAWVALLSGADGRPAWVDSYGGKGDDMYTMIVPTEEGWMLIGEFGQAVPAGDGQPPAFEGKPFIMLYGANGKKGWTEPIMLGGSGVNRVVSAVAADVGWVLLGETDSRSALMPSALGGMDIWALYLRESGTVQWQRRLGGSKDDMARSVEAIPPGGPWGGYILLCTSRSSDGHVTGAHGAQDLWVLNISPNGQLQWQQTLGGGEDSTPAGIIPLANGGLLVAGTTTSQDGDIGLHTSVRTGFLSALSSSGNLLSTTLVGGSEECRLLDLRADEDGAYLMGTIRCLRDGEFVEDLFIARLSEAWETGERKGALIRISALSRCFAAAPHRSVPK